MTYFPFKSDLHKQEKIIRTRCSETNFVIKRQKMSTNQQQNINAALFFNKQFFIFLYNFYKKRFFER
jgi:hypothetical protein